MSMFRNIWPLALLVPLLGHAQHEAAGRLSCLAGEPISPGVAAASAALSAKPDGISERLALAQALAAEGCNQDAVEVLERGAQLHPGNVEIERSLRDARSLFEEQRYFAGREQAEAEARITRNLLRCRQLNDLKACEAAIEARPQDAGLRVATGDAHRATGAPARAIASYRAALSIEPGNTQAAERMNEAQAARKALLSSCLEGSGPQTIDVCDRALLRGAEDEFRIQKRRGTLFQASAQPAEALAAFIAAMTLNPSDQAVARAIVSLTEQSERGDALALQMRGQALLALQMPAEAVQALETALRIDPELGQAQALLRIARRQSAASTNRADPPVARTASANAGRTATAGVRESRSFSNAPIATSRSY
ncbi:MAG: tetratricopeptide repeat protein [Steroidobacteraceae bacterium]